MDVLVSNIALPAFSDEWVRLALGGAVRAFTAFSLVLLRVSGLLTMSPVFGHPDIPLQVRVLLALSLSFMTTPLIVGGDGRATFRRIDQNRDGWVTSDEIPAHLADAAAAARQIAGKPYDTPLAEREFQIPLPLPKTPVEYIALAVAEYSLGFALGLGVLTILSALEMAGQLIDQQTGVSLGDTFNPDLDTTGSLTGQFLNLLGVTTFLLVGGHFLVISALVGTFETLPVGFATLPAPVIQLLSDFVYQSLVLSLKVAAPILATMALVGFAMGFLGHTIPQINVLIIGFPVRMLVGLLLLALALPAMIEIMAPVFPDAIRQLQTALPEGAAER